MHPEELREAYLQTLPRLPFPPDDVLFRPNNNNNHDFVRWDWAKDDFPEGFSNEFSEFVLSPPNHPFVESGSHDDYRLALEDLELAMTVASSMPWTKKQATSINPTPTPTLPRVWCHREIEGTVCAVHRWDAVEDAVAAGTTTTPTIGRLQCWNDPGLRISDPSFIEEQHPEFDDADGEGSTCVLELAVRSTNNTVTTTDTTQHQHHHFVAMGFPAGCAKIVTNRVRIEENWDVGWEIEIDQDSDTVPTVLHKMKSILAILMDSKGQDAEL